MAALRVNVIYFGTEGVLNTNIYIYTTVHSETPNLSMNFNTYFSLKYQLCSNTKLIE